VSLSCGDVLTNIVERMYRVLLTMPCSCTMKWIDGKHIITRTCSRCRVMEEYRNEVKELEAQSV